MPHTVFTAFVSACVISSIYDLVVLCKQWETCSQLQRKNIDPRVLKEKNLLF